MAGFRKWYKQKWRHLLPYLLVCGIAVAGVAGLTHTSHDSLARDQRIARQVDFKLCVEINKNKASILALVNQQGATASFDLPPEVPQYIKDILAQSAARSADFRAEAAKELAPQDCNALLVRHK